MPLHRQRVSSGTSLVGAVRIYWVTDLHFKASVDGDPDAEGAIGSGVRHYYSVSQKLDQFVADVNADQPDLAICTGDIIDDADDFDMFTERWDRITVTKELTIGNHDLVIPYNTVVQRLGYEDRPDVAGSKFQRSFTITNGRFGVRVIVLDSNIDSSGNHASIFNTAGLVYPDAYDWITSELQEADERVVLMFMHHGPHDGHWRDMARIALDQAIQAGRRPGQTVYCLFGHHHIDTSVKSLSGMSVPGVRSPCLVDYNPGRYVVLYVLPDGRLAWRTNEVKFGLPQ